MVNEQLAEIFGLHLSGLNRRVGGAPGVNGREMQSG